MKNKELYINALIGRISELVDERDDEREALRRSRNMVDSLTSVINSNNTSSLEDRAIRLFNMCKGTSITSFTTREQKDFWMGEFISLIK